MLPSTSKNNDITFTVRLPWHAISVINATSTYLIFSTITVYNDSSIFHTILFLSYCIIDYHNKMKAST